MEPEYVIYESKLNYLELEQLEELKRSETIEVLEKLSRSENKDVSDLFWYLTDIVSQIQYRGYYINPKNVSLFFSISDKVWVARKTVKGKTHYIKKSPSKRIAEDAIIEYCKKHNMQI